MENEKSYAAQMGQGCLQVLKVEIFFELAVMFVVGPLFEWIFNTWVLGNTPVFNETMFFSLLSPVGFLLTVLLFLAAALGCYYEVSCLIYTVYWCRKGKKVELGMVLKNSLGFMKAAKHPSFLLAAVYFVLFLPLVHAGYLNSLVSRVEIPRFVLGELQRTKMGGMGVLAVRGGYTVVFLALLLIPMAMVLKQMSFGKAVKQNFSWYCVIGWLDKVKLWAVFILWILVESWILDSLRGKIITKQDFNISILKYFMRSSSYREGMMYAVLLLLLQCVAMAAVFLYVFSVLDKYKELPMLTEPEQAGMVVKNTSRTAVWGRKLLAKMGKKIWVVFGLVLVVSAAVGYSNESPALHKPWAIGHRGCIYEAENTTAAVKKAAESGADYAEIDVQLSKDGIPVVVHDEDLTRLAGRSKKVEDMTAAELQKLTITSNGREGTIPTLEEMIKVVQSAGSRTGLLVELKPSADNQQELAEKVIQLVEQYQAGSQCIFMSIDYETVYLLQAEHPEWWVGYCIYGGAGRIEEAVWDYDIDFLAVEEGLASNNFLEKARDNWLPVYVWTSNNFDDMENYLQMGALGIITDIPDLARETIDEHMKNNQEYYVHEGEGYPKDTRKIAGGI